MVPAIIKKRRTYLDTHEPLMENKLPHRPRGHTVHQANGKLIEQYVSFFYPYNAPFLQKN